MSSVGIGDGAAGAHVACAPGSRLDANVMTVHWVGLMTTSHADAPERLLFNGGDWLKQSRSVTSGLLVRHPRATFLFEGGVGSRIQGEFERNFNGWQKALFAHVYERPLLEQLQSAGIDPATIDFLLLTHLHRDHAGVTRPFPLTRPLRSAARTGSTGAFETRARLRQRVAGSKPGPRRRWRATRSTTGTRRHA